VPLVAVLVAAGAGGLSRLSAQPIALPPPQALTLLERDGCFYGRGSGDDTAMAAIFVENVIHYKREGVVPDRGPIIGR
jgi:hypothetical protein